MFATSRTLACHTERCNMSEQVYRTCTNMSWIFVRFTVLTCYINAFPVLSRWFCVQVQKVFLVGFEDEDASAAEDMDDLDDLQAGTQAYWHNAIPCFLNFQIFRIKASSLAGERLHSWQWAVVAKLKASIKEIQRAPRAATPLLSTPTKCNMLFMHFGC